ncbi:MAG: hypothetical protein UX91_C0006G0029 [Candidatus Amesbacteria bacterium GW2011_GWB1_47_19]|nr:MAG: hypothetical protein UW51_C0002G0029 [Candidatus Amesbacteria bacterium GW2011_GWA1_44_24]KKU31381.1 MAG: hypothetical protein UX46_C0006G0173 [Candidatus Amesbacteria bacterium GW2011_GWC1_46_24]KKU66967.1 MAG: hypothetical protein UX91_C0006G0029 [Candidatus Amesbacteria bacterium GW2011_GWB1_47_19]OGD06413.1 MAG: hypothetical protein A2379_02110 [Candidatus Amesbacteria bacterium RIFOXYB1_FULL_47_13]
MSVITHLFLPHHTNNQRAKILHPSSLLVVLSLVLVFQMAVGKISYRYPRILGYASVIQPVQILTLTNQQRQSQGLPALELDPQLSAAAARKAADMFARDYWSHVSPAGTQPWTFITAAGYSYRYAGENLARDFSDPDSVVQAWMNSPSHRENMLSNRYRDMGVAVADGNLGGRETTLVVQMFGTRLGQAPATAAVGSAFTVKAQEVLPTSAPVTSPFTLTKIFSVSLLVLFAAVLLLDVVIVNRRRLVRWTSKSFAHFIFLAVVALAAITLIRGQII